MKKIIYLILICFILSSCATGQKRLAKISLGMTKDEVIRAMGQPKVIRGALRNKFGHKCEVWEYEFSTKRAGEVFGDAIMLAGNYILKIGSLGIIAPTSSQGSGEQIDAYWFYFYDDELVKWGLAGDWEDESEDLYETDFEPSNEMPHNVMPE